MRRPVSVGSKSLYGQRSLPQMQARVTRTSASVGSTIVASGTFSTRTSPARYMIVARMSRGSPLAAIGSNTDSYDLIEISYGSAAAADVSSRRPRAVVLASCGQAVAVAAVGVAPGRAA